MRLSSECHDLDFNSIEGIYVGKTFHNGKVKYVKERGEIEVEERLRYSYQTVKNRIKLTKLV